MDSAVAATLGYAVGIAISPIPIAGVLLMLLSGRSRSNSVSFLLGWLTGIAVMAIIGQAIPGLESSGGEPSQRSGWVKLILGLLLLLVALRQWRSRSTNGEVPRWMRGIDGLRPPAAIGLGFLLSGVNPKNLLLGLAAGSTIAAEGLSVESAVAATVVYVVIAGSTVLIPVVSYLLAGDRLDEKLAETKDWLIANNNVILGVLFLVFGVLLIGQGLEILLA